MVFSRSIAKRPGTRIESWATLLFTQVKICWENFGEAVTFQPIVVSYPYAVIKRK
jgi:hypothetical protein